MMNQEEKKLLLIDLCARLPYDNTYVQYTGDVPTGLGAVKLNHEIIKIIETLPKELNITIKPYLRPMESMTEEEYKEYDKAKDLDCESSSNALKENLKSKSRVLISSWYHGTDWLIAHGFDYRDLISKKLAIDITKNNYTSNEKIQISFPC